MDTRGANSVYDSGRQWRMDVSRRVEPLGSAATARQTGSTEVTARLIERLELRDHPLDHTKPALPERRIAGVEPEGGEQLRMVLGAAGREHFEITLCESFRSMLVDRIKRIHQAVAKRIGIDVKRRVHEMRDIGPEGFITGLDLDCGPQALALHFEPDRVEPIRREFTIAALGVHHALESVEGDLPHHRIDHVLDFGGEHGLTLLVK